MFGFLGNLSAFATTSVPANFEAIDKEIIDGLKNERPRMDKAREIRDYYEGNFEPYQQDYGKRLGIREDREIRRAIPYVRAVIDAKVRRLYMTPPKRVITDQPEASKYLEEIYAKGRVTPKLKDAIVYAGLGGACAIQVEPNQPKDDAQTQATLSLLRPAVGFRIWPADEFAVWCSPDEPIAPYAVAVLDKYDNQTRCRLWTPEILATYVTKKWDQTGNTKGTRVFERISVEENFLGLTPFAFMWWKAPTKDFWSWCPGYELMRANESANARLTKINDDTIFTRPMTFARNVREDWKAPDRYKAGDIVRLAGLHETIGEGEGPSLDSNIADLSYLSSDREELEAYLELMGDLHGVPKEQWRNRSNGATSGVAILSEALPVIEDCEARQIFLEEVEQDLALVTLMTVQNWLGESAGDALAPIQAALADFSLSVQWPPLTKNRPGPDYDQHNQFLLVNELSSPIQVYQEMAGISEQEAIEHFEKAAEHKQFLQQLAGPVDPMTGQPLPAATDGEESPELQATEVDTEEDKAEGDTEEEGVE